MTADPVVTNSILWADSASNGKEIYIESGSPEIEYCNVHGGYDGRGNINLDPDFRDPEEGDFHLMSTEYGYPFDSPCIDTGSLVDLDSLLSEFWGLGTVYCDMGAFGGGARQGSIINVPEDYPAIQLGIDAADQNDTILVQPGIYTENITIDEIQLFVGSLLLTTGDTTYISSTIIDGGNSGPVVRFVDCENRMVVFSGFTVRHGQSYVGGGINCSRSSPEISFNRIEENKSNDGGGGIYCQNSSPVVHHNIISDNVEDGYFGGGGIFGYDSDALIYNNLIINNISSWRGGALSFWTGEPLIVNNTVSGNLGDLGGAIFNYSSNPIILNTIFWADSALTDSNEIYTYGGGSVDIRYSDIEGGWPGDGNIDLDPLFRDTVSGDFHLMSIGCGDSYDSPCIDAGDPALFDSFLDCAGGLGEWRSDMGSYGGWDSTMTSIDNDQSPMPRNFILEQNYPNPFNALTTIEFTLSGPEDVKLTIYDLLGRRIRILLDQRRNAGTHLIKFDASALASGVYFYRLRAGEVIETKRMVLLK